MEIDIITTTTMGRIIKTKDDDILLSFKAWVMKQDDNINEDDACKNFKLYKAEFKKKQMQEFFVTHKDEECLKEPIKPDSRCGYYSHGGPILIKLEILLFL